MSTTYKTVITDKGTERIAAALLPDGEKLKITHFAVGDGNGSIPTPVVSQTALVHEVYRGEVSNIRVDTDDTTRIIVEGIIPVNQGGFWVREIGLYDDRGVLVAVCSAPERYKPVPTEGAASVLNCQTYLVVSNTSAVQLKVLDNAFLPDATTDTRGLTILSNAIDSDDETKSATPKAVNNVRKQLPVVASNIRDRTSGRVALPGMFGYGALFSSSDRTEFKSGTDFLRWVKTAKPGRYTVFADTNVVVPGIQTNGVIEIIWTQPKTSLDDEHAYKVIIYYGVNGHIYYNRYAVSSNGGYLIGWENLKVDEASLRALIETRAPLKSPALTGAPTTPTPPDDAAGNEIA
ncbi:phage tail protein, partial [Escherichia coli]|uniref:phage tail protein n=1 Tax=Escherichia coli TaxID=562 RepID=UPI0039BEDAB6